MSRLYVVLLTVGVFAVAGAVVVALRGPRGGSVRASLQALADGARAKDRDRVERYLDLRRTAESVVDEASAAALAAGDSSGTDEATRSLLVVVLEQSIWTTLVDPAESGRFQGIADVQQRDDLARVGVRIRLGDGDSAALVHLRMERVAGDWRVVGVEGLGPYMQAALARRRARAAAAESARVPTARG